MRQTIHFFGRNFRCRDVAFFRCSNAHHSTLACRLSARRALHDHCLINKVRFDPSIDSKGKSLSLLMTPGYGVNERRDSGLSQFVRVKYRKASHALAGRRSIRR